MSPQRFVAILICSLCLQQFGPQITVAKPMPGKKKAFGAGLLTGALAGAMVGRVFSHKSHQQQQEQQQPTQASWNYVTTIEKGPPQPNGCYQQITKEPDAHDPSKYVETVRLICPSSQPTPFQPVAAAAAATAAAAARGAPTAVPWAIATSPAEPTPTTSHLAGSPMTPVQQQPSISVVAEQPEPELPRPAQSSAAGGNNQPPHPMQPSISVQTAPQTPQVYVLSKTLHSKKSAASTQLCTGLSALLPLIAAILVVLQ